MSAADERPSVERVSVVETELKHMATKADLKATEIALTKVITENLNDLKGNHLKHIEERIDGLGKEIVDRESR